MMKITLMKRFFDTVSDERRSPIAEKIAGRWFEENVKVRVVRASSNFITHVETPENTYYLRFNHSTERTREFIEAELSFIQHLTNHGIHANRPIPSLSELIVETVPTEMGDFHGVLFEAIQGNQYESDELNLEKFRSWGSALGKVHKESTGLVVPGIPTWKDHISRVRSMVSKSDEVIWSELDSVEMKLNALPVDDGIFGIIHFDFEMDNLLWNKDSVGIVDFDDCAYYWYAADIAYALRDLYEDQVDRFNVDDERVQAFLEAYRSIRPISEEELSHIPIFIRLHNLYTYTRLYRSIEDDPATDEPQWVRNIRDKLRKKIETYCEDIEMNPI